MRHLLLLLASLASAAHAGTPRRIVSLNLCADQLLLATADPAQIAGLTALSHLPSSPIAAEAGRYPVVGASAEALLAAAPDLILTGWPGQTAPATQAGLKAETIVVPPANSYGDIMAQLRLVAAAVGHPERGEALIHRMDAELARIARSGGGRTAADYQRHGYLSGSGTLVDDMMRRVGLVNLATELGLPPLANLPLEQLVAHRPDFLIGATGPARDLGSMMLQHPAIAAIRRLRLPSALLDCGGPSYPKAIRILSEQLRRSR